MPISSIKRDWGTNPCIVRILTSDTIAISTVSGYLSAQLPFINDINKGVFQFVASDTIELSAVDGVVFCLFQNNDFSTLIPFSGDGALTGTALTIARYNAEGDNIESSNILSSSVLRRDISQAMGGVPSALFFLASTATESGGTVSINAQCGIITTSVLTTSPGASYTIILHDPYLQGPSNAFVNLTLINDGTNAAGNAILLSYRPDPISKIIIDVLNLNPGPLNGTIRIAFWISR